MARRRHDVDIGINAKDNASKSVGKVEKSFSRLGGVLAGAFAAATAAAAAGLVALGGKLDAGIAKQAEYEKGLSGLSNAFSRAGADGAAASTAFADVADQLERSTNVAAEASIDIARLGLAFDVAAEDVSAFTQATLDFAAGADLQATEAARRLGRAMQGSAGDVANFNAEIRNLTKEQLAAGEATKLIAETFQGAAAAAIDNYTGSVERLDNAYENLTKTLAKNVTANRNVVTGNRQLAESVDQVNKNLADQSGFVSQAIKWWQNAKTNLRVLLGVNAEYLTSLGKVNVGLGKVTDTQEKYNEATEETIRLEHQLIDNTNKFEAALKKLGVTLEAEVNEEIENNNALLIAADELLRRQKITREDYERIQRAVTEANQANTESLEEETEAFERSSDAMENWGRSAEVATGQVIQLRQETDRATVSAQAASGQFAQNLLGGRSTFAQVSGGTFAQPAPKVVVNEFGKVITT